ncbi:MAG: hypothetical protein ACLU8F_04530 [Clostridia bacterium]
MADEKKKLEIISGDSSNLEISPVYDHLNVAKPKLKERKGIIVPKTGKVDKKKEKKKD